ncbi:MAG: hypothetical protein HC849_20220 [Oscillatoriales cyanobacterium RU_3_3]|nr:hypothetical protein [Microcoleus sp. SU_5_6]NJL67606.1 hypothetical protein [Microcoleus sp. SM1_3_4]NJM61993.1 hypothetical protein [Oscillatoriales cyanobacterium RU_3_3]NJR22737.1 hypothetical protein [Richelia sp. CSU_2_1]
MQTQTLPFPTEQIVNSIFQAGELSRADRHQLQALLSNDAIGENELSSIEKVIDAVLKGILDVLY